MLASLFTWFLSKVASLIVLVAQMGISPQSTWTLYEPDIPETLKNKV